ncbi:hypothetical protein CERSUDRAFT_142250 [Gelatoporia subvermispora B]|uniref:Cytochrome P450 n=1 Tax=Ceriporiopsis subvermispora (strain B) TaxID=914234 RepID=M2R549_CERS8|nr:hypothetical protein CERSUDRAFT_142250 [Gelatoporia subvermispora B]
MHRFFRMDRILRDLSPDKLPSYLSLLFVSVALLYALSRRRSRLSLPPGPSGLPIIGNTLQMPHERQWLQFTEWAKAYGDIVYLSVLGTPVIILNSSKVISELLDKRSAIYSDRPSLPMAGELVGYDASLPLCHYGPRHRELRKLFAEAINPRTARGMYPIFEQKVQQFLSRITKSPMDLVPNIRLFVASIVFQVSHGRDVVDRQDPLVIIADQATEDFSAATVVGAFLVDVMPILKYVPEWFPGAEFKRQARKWRKTMKILHDEEYDVIVSQAAHGKVPSSFTTSLVERNPDRTPEQDDIFRWASAGMYSGMWLIAQDSVSSAIESFFLAMSLHPDVQHRAHEELDRVVGTTRVPDIDDRSHLPYIEALLREVYRWNPVAPTALPHRLIEDDVYEGYRIPAGALVVPNSWLGIQFVCYLLPALRSVRGIMHDPAIYPNPMEFKPERYLAAQARNLNPDPRSFAFGYGRRVCPGQRLADDVLFATVAITLSLFDVSPPRDATGSSKRVEVEYTAGSVSHPKNLECHITPRSAAAENLLAASSGE